ncbi:MAG: PP2C family protein-serine/threonine phosphatase [Gemmataceae bacterium]
MTSTFATPQTLVEALQVRDPAARTQLWQLLREPLTRLIEQLIQRHQLPEDRTVLTLNALHAAETALRAQPSHSFANRSWPAFRATLLVQLARLVSIPHGVPESKDTARASLALPNTDQYRFDTFSRPYSQIGSRFFGGDWYAGHHAADGSVWIFLADVTGHGYFAYLLATALPAVWQRCWAGFTDSIPQPTQLLERIHDLLVDSLPEGIFLEATLVRLGLDGQSVIVPAGGTRFVLRSNGRSPQVVKLRGSWLGLFPPTAQQEHPLQLADGDELLLVTDGAFDQLDEQGGLEALAREWRGGSTFQTLLSLLQAALSRGPQKDDITVIWLERTDPCVRGNLLRFPGVAHV